MSLVVEKLDHSNFDIYKHKILRSIIEEYQNTYKIVVHDNQINKVNEYCISYMYLLIFKSNKTNNKKLLGYFSLSLTDLNKSSNIVHYVINYVFGNVYLFDVYVYSKYRNKGIGTYLVTKAVQTAKNEYNATNIYLYTKSITLTNFYKKNKFYFVRYVEMDNNKLLLFQRKIIN